MRAEQVSGGSLALAWPRRFDVAAAVAQPVAFDVWLNSARLGCRLADWLADWLACEWRPPNIKQSRKKTWMKTRTSTPTPTSTCVCVCEFRKSTERMISGSSVFSVQRSMEMKMLMVMTTTSTSRSRFSHRQNQPVHSQACAKATQVFSLSRRSVEETKFGQLSISCL